MQASIDIEERKIARINVIFGSILWLPRFPGRNGSIPGIPHCGSIYSV